MAASPGRLLRRLAELLVRGPDAPFVLGDMEEALHRDLASGISIHRARWRYAINLFGSVLSLARYRFRVAPRRPRIGASLLDLKLALRMLIKHPGLTAVAVFALALGIPASLAPIHLLNTFDVTLPFDDDERIVGLRHWRAAELEEVPGSGHELTVWRETLSSFEHVGAAFSARYNLIAEDGRARPYRGARMSASSFAIVRVPPLIGRPLLESDEVVGAPDVVVLGYGIWQSFYDANADVIGRTLRVGGVPHTIVGVMPEGFLFPEHDEFWLPLRAGALAGSPGEGPDLWIYGRLANGVTEAQALAEMTSVHRGLADAYPEVYGELRPEIVPFTRLTTGNPRAMWWFIAPVQLFAFVLLAVACGNVGILILARTASRSGEIAVRTALGASRARIVSQLFVESLVLALLSTGLGLALASFVAEQVATIWEGGSMPFWFDFGVDHRIVLPALGVAVFSAVIAGVLPALKATGRTIQVNLQRASAGRSSIRFGRATTVLIVSEIALGVLALFGGVVASRVLRLNTPTAMQIRPEEYLAAELRLSDVEGTIGGDEGERAFRGRIAAVQQDLVRRLTAEPAVRGVAIARALPGQYHTTARVEVDGQEPGQDERGHLVMRGSVDVGFFEGLGAPMLEGRDFTPGDLSSRADESSRTIIVNTAFVQRVLGGRNAIGQRVRSVGRGDGEPGPWLEIVGVVGSLGMIDQDPLADDAGFYQAVSPGVVHPVRMAIHVTGEPSAFGARLRQIAAAIDPGALVVDPMPLTDVNRADRRAMRWMIFAVGVVAAIAIVLSIAGLYALMSFTVAQRRHEIGVRTALGADSGAIMSLIVKRALMQLAIGIGLGVGTITVLIRTVLPGNDTELSPLRNWPLVLAGTAVTVVLVGIVACVAPTLRGLRIRPIEALKM